MGQKTSPIGFRIGIRLDWLSTWYSPKANYGTFLVEDQRIRQYVERKFNQEPPYTAVARVEIARTRNEVKVVLHTARPGMVIGPRGAEVEKLCEALGDVTGRKINVSVVEIKEPALNAKLVGDLIAAQLRKRSSFRRVMKQQCEAAMAAGAKGVKIMCSGRLGGAEMCRKETQKLGSIPLQTIDANVDYAISTSRTTYGAIGVKVWIYKGKFGEEIEPISRPKRGRDRERRGPSSSGGSKPRGRGAAPRRDVKAEPAQAVVLSEVNGTEEKKVSDSPKEDKGKDDKGGET